MAVGKNIYYSFRGPTIVSYLPPQHGASKPSSFKGPGALFWLLRVPGIKQLTYIHASETPIHTKQKQTNEPLKMTTIISHQL